MGNGVVLDTSYLIALADPGRASHDAARRYWQYFMERGVPVYLPTIVVSEFCLRQPIPVGILRSCVVLPFNWADAMKSAELDFTRFKDRKIPRDALKDDIKILAQAEICAAAYLITDDGRTMHQTAVRLKDDGEISYVSILLANGFDGAIFENGRGCFNKPS